MIDRRLKNKLLEAVQKKELFENIVNVLIDFKYLGGKQNIAYETLKKIRSFFIEKGEEDFEDTVLEVMDIVSGYCFPSHKIWENDIGT